MVPSRSEKILSRLRKALASTHGPTRTTGAPMFTKTLVLVLSLTSSVALAQAVTVPTDAQVTAEKAACETKYNPNVAPTTLKVSIALAQEKCKLEVDVKVLQAKVQASGAKSQFVEDALKQLSTSLAETNAKLKALESAPKVDAKKPPVDAAPLVPAAVMPPVMTGAPFMVVEAQGQIMASTRDLPELTSRYKILNVGEAAKHFLNQKTVNARAVVLKNGRPIAVMDPSAPCLHNPRLPGCFTEFFADMNHDGAPELIPYKGVDPAFLDTVYVATEPGDTIEIVYLVPVGNRKVAINGMPHQTLWGYPVRVKLHQVERMGRYQISVFSGNAH